MMTWTLSARDCVERYLEDSRARLGPVGADIEEVVADLRRHIEEEAALHQLQVVTEEDARAILAMLATWRLRSHLKRRQTECAGHLTRGWGWAMGMPLGRRAVDRAIAPEFPRGDPSQDRNSPGRIDWHAISAASSDSGLETIANGFRA